jgi:hypothetical protein
MSQRGDGGAINPFARLDLAGAGQGRIDVVALRRGRGWETMIVRREERPSLFALLTAMAAADGDVEIDDCDVEALRTVGLWVTRDETPNEVRFAASLDDAAASDAADADAADADALIVHPGLSAQPPAGVEVPRGNLQPGAIAWVADARTAVTVPYWLDGPTAALLDGAPGAAPPPLDPTTRRRLRAAGLLVRRNEVERQGALRARELAATSRIVADKGYAILPTLLPRAQLLALQRYCRALIGEGHVRFGDPQVPGRYVQHNEPMSRLLLTALTRVVGAAADMRLRPAYAYFASYRPGAALKIHRDRPQCALSVSFLIDYAPLGTGPSPWPLWMRRSLGDEGEALHQHVGDAIIYRGCELYHSRDPLPEGHRSTHLFFHYVPHDFDGPLD